MNSRQNVELGIVTARDTFATLRRDLSAIGRALDREEARLADIAVMLDRASDAIYESQLRIGNRPDRPI